MRLEKIREAKQEAQKFVDMVNDFETLWSRSKQDTYVPKGTFAKLSLIRAQSIILWRKLPEMRRS